MDSKDDVENIVIKAITDDKLLSELLSGILSKNEEIRSNNFQILLKISKVRPKILYFKWDFLVDLLISDNHFHRYILNCTQPQKITFLLNASGAKAF